MSNYFKNYNNKYKQLFCIQNTDRCNNAEAVELYQNIITKEFVLYRYTANNCQTPLTNVIKFTDLVQYEIYQEDFRYILNIIIVYKDFNISAQRFTACSGSVLFVQNVENELIKIFF